MSCVPHVMYGVVFVLTFAVALFRICIKTSKLRCCCSNCVAVLLFGLYVSTRVAVSGSVALSRGSALPLPLRLKMSGHAALSCAALHAAATTQY